MNRPDASEIAQTRAFWAATPFADVTPAVLAPSPPAAWRVAAALAVALVAQGGLAPTFAVRDGVAPLVLLVVAWYAVRAGTVRGLTLGLVAGIFEDALAGATGVAWTFATALGGALAGRLANTRYAESPFALAPLAALLVAVRFAAFVILMRVEGRPLAAVLHAAHAVAWQALLGAVVALLAVSLRPSLLGTRANGR